MVTSSAVAHVRALGCRAYAKAGGTKAVNAKVVDTKVVDTKVIDTKVNGPHPSTVAHHALRINNA